MDVSAFGGAFGILLRWRSPTGQATAWAVALIAPPVIAASTESFRASLGLTGFLFCALLVVVLAALIGGQRPALAAVAIGFLAGDYAFAVPYNAFSLYLRAENAPLVVFVVVGAAVATLVARAASAEELFAAATEEVGGLFAVDLAGMGRFEADGTVTILAGWRG